MTSEQQAIDDPPLTQELLAMPFVAWGDWVTIAVGRHTCGTDLGGYYGAHEPGCGLEPEFQCARPEDADYAARTLNRLREAAALSSAASSADGGEGERWRSGEDDLDSLPFDERIRNGL